MNADVLVDTAPPALLACLFEICDEVVELRLVLDAGERHFVARNELVRVGEIGVEILLVPRVIDHGNSPCRLRRSSLWLCLC